MKKPRTVAAALGAALALVGVIGVAAPAQAATSNCPSGYVCVWGDENFKTDGTDSGLVKFYYYIPNYGGYNYEGKSINANDTISSIYNHGNTETAYMYEHANKAGFLFSIPKGNSNSNLYWVGYNDKISSGYFASYN